MAIRKYLTGKKFGRLFVISLAYTGTRTYWNVICDCGTKKVVESYSLHTGHTLSCGCLQKELKKSSGIKVAIGTRFGKLTIVKEGEKLFLPCGQNDRSFLCACDCGNEKIVRLGHLRSGKIKSCGCSQGEQHNLSNTKIYGVWSSMNQRCHKTYVSESNKRNYQDRGITVCYEWKNSFLSFYTWAKENGYKPSLQIDRTNNDMGYSPENCRWVTRLENVNNTRVNRRITIGGITKNLATWARENSIPNNTLRFRVVAGWPDDKLFIEARLKGFKKSKFLVK